MECLLFTIKKNAKIKEDNKISNTLKVALSICGSEVLADDSYHLIAENKILPYISLTDKQAVALMVVRSSENLAGHYNTGYKLFLVFWNQFTNRILYPDTIQMDLTI